MKVALLIGINYTSGVPEYVLQDSIKNMMTMKQLLITHYGYVESNIFTLRDDDALKMPTRASILTALNDLVISSKSMISYTEVCIHYCGHGSHIQNMNEGTPKVEGIIVPVDYKNEGFIEDDIIFKYVSHIKCPVLLIMDTNNSGNMCDLEFGFTNLHTTSENPKLIKNPNIILFSGSNDEMRLNMNDTSGCDVSDNVFTNSLLESLRTNGYYKAQIGKVNQDIYEWLKQHGKSLKQGKPLKHLAQPLPLLNNSILPIQYDYWNHKQPKLNMIFHL
jgi:hypothetical protein